jgi:hypothetical protein
MPAGTVSYKKKNMKIFFFASLKSLKKGVGSGVRSGSISQRYGPADPDSHQNVTDPQHCFQEITLKRRYYERNK